MHEITSVTIEKTCMYQDHINDRFRCIHNAYIIIDDWLTV